ncbi:TolC family protein [Danxiaibacter flavus]|uniref:TolC family protein n=1 Tax=Danxiaibacter flavus TaxID=3049108 RepID=A0ABV3ZIP7_9BACT|nr:TolC family protein [Chitinophagaceae bacterium DXS]
MQYLKRIGTVCLFSATAFMSVAQSPQAVPASQTSQETAYHEFSVQQCVEYARKNNVQVKNALIDYKIQQQTNRGITATALPQVNGSVGTNFFPNVPVQVFPNFIAMGTYGVLEHEGVKNGSGQPITSPADFGYISAAFGTKWNASAGVTLSQILFDGQVFVGLQARKASLDYQMKNFEVTDENIRTNIYKVYYQLVVSKTQMEQIDANITRTAKLYNDTKAMHANGFTEQLDVDRAAVQLANLETQKLTTQRTIDNGYLGLKYLIGMPIQDSIVLTDKITEDNIRKGLLEDSTFQYSDRKDYQLLEQVNILNDYNVKRYKYMYLPSANLTSQFAKQAYRGQFDFIGKGDWFTTWFIGLNINIPIFDGMTKAANVQKAKLQAEQTHNQMEYLKLNIDTDVETARNKFRAAIITLENQRNNMKLAEQVYNQSRKKYEAGLGSTTDITNSQTDLINAQTNFINALYDAVIAKIDYTKAIGKLP